MGDKAVRILLVEDHADTASVMSHMSRRMGHAVWTAGTCAEARRTADAGALDLMLCDIDLPDGDGCDLMRKLCERSRLEGVAVTGHVYPADRDRCLASPPGSPGSSPSRSTRGN